jgi:hypothetical protein
MAPLDAGWQNKLFKDILYVFPTRRTWMNESACPPGMLNIAPRLLFVAAEKRIYSITPLILRAF